MDDIDREYFAKMQELGTELHDGDITKDEHTKAVLSAFQEFTAKYPDHVFSLYWMTHPFDPQSLAVVV